jgi:choline dehydrogenase-like flavoprotein
MLTDSNSIPRGTRMSADVCIVGAGAAGITLALSLLEKNIDVIVLESGYDRKDARTQGLYAGEVADARLHSPPDKYRLRQFGGSTLIWGGRCVPFDPVDFEIRASVPNSGWPISYSELLRYYPAANELSEAGRFEYDADQLIASSQDGFARCGCKIDGDEIKKRRREPVHRTGAAPDQLLPTLSPDDPM